MLPWPRTSRNWRWLFSPLLAAAITLALFYWMFQLLNQKPTGVLAPIAPVMVNIDRVDVPIQEKPHELRQPPPKPVPSKPNVAAKATIAAAPAPSTSAFQGMALQPAALDDKVLAAQQQNWSAPSAAQGQTGADYIGQADTGTTAFTPISTRRPNIPKVAYDNHINGWVLLAFSVTHDGKVKDIQVMDASPRGVFEAYAVKAVKTWIYPAYKGEEKRLSQRIEFKWDMYSYNMDY